MEHLTEQAEYHERHKKEGTVAHNKWATNNYNTWVQSFKPVQPDLDELVQMPPEDTAKVLVQWILTTKKCSKTKGS